MQVRLSRKYLFLSGLIKTVKTTSNGHLQVNKQMVATRHMYLSAITRIIVVITLSTSTIRLMVNFKVLVALIPVFQFFKILATN